jgi:UDP-N-acetylglucosamine transferase subunit ALG13
MKTAFEEKNLRKIRILVAPLDWGLGHATRCIPVINELRRQGCDVWVAGEGPQEMLLKQEFPDLPFIPLPGYRVNYAQSASGMLWSMFSQSGKILAAIKQENNWMKKMVSEHGFDAVISDNRYGLYHKNIRSVFITHQLTIKSPLGKWTEKLLQKINYHYINRFSACWVPDEGGENNLAGELSHPIKKPGTPIRYIGPLSRSKTQHEISSSPLEPVPLKREAGGKDHLLIILSGPEPQRTILENKIIEDIAHYPATATIVRGLPAVSTIIPSTNSIKFYNHLPAEELNKEMSLAEYIISRSGYSSIMDITKLQKKSILIPTPGQTEQEYLGQYLLQKEFALCISQKEFLLTKALQKAERFSYQLPSFPGDNKLGDAIEQLIASLH